VADGTTSRRERILEAAARAFATHGYRGSSLRDIARDAGCSLTLLDHHFGGKGQLLDAVLQLQHQNCEKRLDGLRAFVDSPAGFGLEEFVERWANYEFDLYTTPQGRLYLAFPSEASVRFPSRRGSLRFSDDPTHRAPPPWTDVIRQLSSSGMTTDFAARRYRPWVAAGVGAVLEPVSMLSRRVMPLGSTWALWGFESVIWATKSE